MHSIARLPSALLIAGFTALAPASALAHGGGASHATGVAPPALHLSSPQSRGSAAPSAAKTAVGSSATPAGGTPAGTIGIDQDVQTAPSPATACEAGEAGNCEARIESYSAVTQGDPNPAWSAPTPTAIPPTPPAPQITEPAEPTGPIIEESGGASRTEAVGGGPTLADCMALWD